MVKLGLAALALSFVLSGCNGGGDAASKSGGATSTPEAVAGARPEPTADTVKVEGDTIKIGIVGSQTGDQKPWGDDSIDGAKLAVKELNDAGGINGKKVELLVGDSGSKPEQAKSATEKLISEGVVAVLGEVASGNTIQMAKAAFGKAIPVVGIGATRTDLSDEGTHVVRVCYTDAFQGPVVATFAYEELGLRNIGIVTDNKAPYSQGLSKSFRDTFEKLGGTVVAEAFYETGQSDFNGQITELKAKNPDGLFLSGYFPEVGPMAQQIRAAGLKDVKLLGGDGWDSEQLLVSGGDAILGSFMCNHYSNAEKSDEVQNFLKKWKAGHAGKVPATTMGALGYDAANLLFDAIKRSASLDSKAFIVALNETENFKAVSGTITLKGKGGNPEKRALIVEIRPKAEGFQVFRKAYEPNEVKK